MGKEKTIRVLIVDDECAFRAAIAFDFKRRGYQVIQAESGQAAIKIVLDSPVDVVLSDIRMANGDGAFLLEQLKKYFPQIPIFIFISGYAELDLQNVYRNGVEAVFPKPFNRTALMSTVERALRDRDRNSPRRSTRIPCENVQCNISLMIAGTERALIVPIFDISLGGMFVENGAPFPEMSATSSFSIKFRDKNQQFEISGIGVVRWICKSGDSNMPSGFGMQFKDLDSKSAFDLISLINYLKTTGESPLLSKVS